MDEKPTPSAAFVAIVGSVDYHDLQAVRAYVRALPRNTTVVSGGARGVDQTAADEARACGLAVIEHFADWNRHRKQAGPIRNALVVRDCQRVVAFWDGQSRGTKNTIEIARRVGKPVEIIEGKPPPAK